MTDAAAERTVHGITWTDELAWMEDMKGERWRAFVKSQNAKFKKELEGVSENIGFIGFQLISSTVKDSAPLLRAAGGTVEISSYGTYSLEWNWSGGKPRAAADIDARRGGFVWAVEEIGDGAEHYAIRAYKKGKGVLWEHKGVGPYVAIVGDRCYCLLAKRKLVYSKLVSWDAKTGKDFKMEYEEKDYRFNLELGRRTDSFAFVRRQAGPYQDILFLGSAGLAGGTAEGMIGSRRYIVGSRPDEILSWSARSGTWKVSEGLRRRGWRLPAFARAVPESIDTDRGFMITKWHGSRTLWKIRRGEPPFTVWRGWGQIVFDPWESSWVRLIVPGCPVTWWDTEKTARPEHPMSWGRELEAFYAKSKDGTKVPFVVVSPPSPKALLVVGYGAYGAPTGLGTSRWEPLLKDGWAVAIGMWRGGGDHTPEWEDAGRVHGRVRVLEDAESVVREARKRTGVDARQTVLYGRSAGGLWVGGMVAKYPDADVFGGAYMEVPYLDVLRTVTNRSLPLTEIETEEFGLPEARLSDFVSTLQWSPMELLVSLGRHPKVWQLVRTGANDSEVYPYESAKWVARCGGRALLALEDRQGHFVSGAVGLEQRAMDLALLQKKSQE